MIHLGAIYCEFFIRVVFDQELFRQNRNSEYSHKFSNPSKQFDLLGLKRLSGLNSLILGSQSVSMVSLSAIVFLGSFEFFQGFKVCLKVLSKWTGFFVANC